MDLSHAVTSPMLADRKCWTIIRSTGYFGAGGWVNNTQELKACGTANVATERDLQQVPEGDRPTAAMIFASRTEMLTTHTGQFEGVSDTIVWREQQWRVLRVGPYPQRGFYTAIAVRTGGTVMSGQDEDSDNVGT
jgi:hypothetical protein